MPLSILGQAVYPLWWPSLTKVMRMQDRHRNNVIRKNHERFLFIFSSTYLIEKKFYASICPETIALMFTEHDSNVSVD